MARSPARKGGQRSCRRGASAGPRVSAPAKSMRASSLRRAACSWNAGWPAPASTRSPTSRRRRKAHDLRAVSRQGGAVRGGRDERRRPHRGAMSKATRPPAQRSMSASAELGDRPRALEFWPATISRCHAALDFRGAAVSRSGDQCPSHGAPSAARRWWAASGGGGAVRRAGRPAGVRAGATAGDGEIFPRFGFLRLIIKALFGEKLKDLRAEIEPDVARSVAFFLAACRSGGVP